LTSKEDKNVSESDIKTAEAEKDIDKEERRKRFIRVRKCFWVAIAILIILLILSIIVLAARMNDYFASSQREVSLNSAILKNELDIFDIRYKNDQGHITVEGMDGQKVVAPGTDVEYTIRVRNTDGVAIDYELLPSVEFFTEHKLPLYVRILDHNDDYILGTAKEWVEISDINGTVHRNTLKRGECVEYTFQWKWPYEHGNDEYDTLLGNINNAGIKVSLTVNAMANLDIDANGGLRPSGWAGNLGIFIFALLLLIAIILLILSIINKRLKKAEPEPEPVIIPVPEPEPEPEPIIVPVIIPEPEPEPVPVIIPDPKKEGFCGKMAYINLDILNDHFESGDVITLSILKKKGLIHPKAKQMKVLARNGYKLDKAFIIETQGVSAEARNKVKEAGGVIIITKG
jgi:cell division protein FtsL